MAIDLSKHLGPPPAHVPQGDAVMYNTIQGRRDAAANDATRKPIPVHGELHIAIGAPPAHVGSADVVRTYGEVARSLGT